ncbi:hypothetical protein FRC10_004172 [Ceratobasidium sp. 414]|nr:hypothetical protein FRC10_004172 [Ceratobasidium sp. 414]
MPSPTSLKRKQSLSTGEPHTLLDFFGTKRPKPSPLRPLEKSSGADVDPIVISDDEDLAESSTTVKPEPVLDLSFTEDEWEAGDDELLVIEDDVGEPSSSECLGDVLLATSVSLGTCTICGLLLVDTTEAEINGHIAQCLVRPGIESVTKIERQPSAASPNKPELASTSKVSPPKSTASKIVNALLMSSREEREAWDSADEAEAARRNTKFARPDVKGKSKAADQSKSNKAVTTANLIKFMLKVDPKWVKPLPDDESVEIPDTGGVRVTLVDANHCKSSFRSGPTWLIDGSFTLQGPGSSLFVFTGKQTVDAGDSPVKSAFVGSNRLFTYLHCGDFRACPAHALHPAIQGQRIDIVYLDTTYLSPKLAKQHVLGKKTKNISVPSLEQTTMGGWFKPSPKLAAQLQPQTSSEPARAKLNQKALVVVGTYTIGKERVLKAIAKALSSKIYCGSRKHAVFMCQADPALHAMLTKDPADAQVHVLPLGQVSIERLTKYLELHRKRHDRILGFRPTGWTYTPPAGQSPNPTIDQVLAQTRAHTYNSTDLRPQRGSNSRVTIYGVPYSEHSSFRELTCFALSVDWMRMIATVNVGSAASRAKMSVWFEKWAKARKDRGDVPVEYRSEEYW